MVNMTVQIKPEVYEALQVLAEIRNMAVEDVFSELVAANLKGIEKRLKDPIIGMIASGIGDLSDRDEGILYGWQGPG